SLRDDDANRPLVAEIRLAGERAATLTRQLLAFSRQQVLSAKVVDLNELLADLSNLLRRLIGEDLRLSFAPSAGGSLMRGDPGQSEKAIVNLVITARDAMPNGGHLITETANVALGEEVQPSPPDRHPGPHVLVTVTDTGRGIPEETKALIFEPFF